MNWEIIGSIGQLVAAVGLIPTLIYLAIQVREQSKANHHASLDLLSTQWTELLKTMSDNSDFGPIYLSGLQDFDALDSPSKLRFGAYLLRIFRYWDGVYFHFLDGTLPAPYWHSIERQIQDIASHHGVLAWWHSRKHWFTDEFGRMLDATISGVKQSNAYAGYGAAPAGRGES